MVFVVHDLVRRLTDWPLPLGKWTRKVSCQWEKLVLTYSNNKFECSSDQLPLSFTVPVLDRILQPSTSVILGPVWVTRGAERFSPKGAYHFITTLLFSTKDRLKQSKAYKQQVWKLMFLKKKGGGGWWGKKNKLTTHRLILRQNCWDSSIYFLSLHHTSISSPSIQNSFRLKANVYNSPKLHWVRRGAGGGGRVAEGGKQAFIWRWFPFLLW